MSTNDLSGEAMGVGAVASDDASKKKVDALKNCKKSWKALLREQNNELKLESEREKKLLEDVKNNYLAYLDDECRERMKDIEKDLAESHDFTKNVAELKYKIEVLDDNLDLIKDKHFMLYHNASHLKQKFVIDNSEPLIN